MKILGYSQILSVLRHGEIKLAGVVYTISPELKSFVEANLPSAGSSFVNGNFLLVASFDEQRNAGEIVGFAPGNPPDPGINE